MDYVSPLTQLVAEVRRDFADRHGVNLSYQDIANRGGNVITRKRVFQIATKPIRDVPPTETIDALAKGLGVPYSVVLEKALLSAGYTLPGHTAPEGRRTG